MPKKFRCSACWLDVYKRQEYGIEDEEGYDENGMRKATGCMGEEFYYMVEDGLIRRDSIDHLGEIIRGKKPGRKSDDEIIFVAIEGMPIEDVAWGSEIYRNAVDHGICLLYTSRCV